MGSARMGPCIDWKTQRDRRRGYRKAPGSSRSVLSLEEGTLKKIEFDTPGVKPTDHSNILVIRERKKKKRKLAELHPSGRGGDSVE